MSDHPRPTSCLRYLQFSCKTLLLLTTLAGLVFAWWSDRREFRKQINGLRDQITVLQAAGGYELWADETATGRFSIGAGYAMMNSPYGNQAAYGPAAYAPRSLLRELSEAIHFMEPGAPFMEAGAPQPPQPSEEAVRRQYSELFREVKGWLSANLPNNQDWKDLLAAYPAPSSGYGAYGTPTTVYPGTQPPTTPYTPPAEVKSKTAKKIPIAKLLHLVRRLLRDGGSNERLAAVRYSSQGLKPEHSHQLIPDVTLLLDDTDPDARMEAAGFLQRLAPASKPALPQLNKLMNTSESYDAVFAAAAVVRIDPQFDVVPRLTKILAGKDLDAGYCAETVLGKLGQKKAAGAVPELLGMLKHKDAAVRERAARLLGGLAPRERAIAVLTAAVKKEKDANVKTLMARIVLRLQGDLQPPADCPPEPPPPVSLNQPRGSSARVYR